MEKKTVFWAIANNTLWVKTKQLASLRMTQTISFKSLVQQLNSAAFFPARQLNWHHVRRCPWWASLVVRKKKYVFIYIFFKTFGLWILCKLQAPITACCSPTSTESTKTSPNIWSFRAWYPSFFFQKNNQKICFAPPQKQPSPNHRQLLSWALVESLGSSAARPGPRHRSAAVAPRGGWGSGFGPPVV